MKKIFTITLVLIAGITALVHFSGPHCITEQLTPNPSESQRVLLLPLDSRPPCTKLVADNGQTAGISVIMPPTQYMDFYTQPGEIASLRSWLLSEAQNAQEAIISIDQLLYGGLIASRNRAITEADIDGLIIYLKELHRKNPSLQLYAFTILPRMTPPDYIEAYDDRAQLLEWSRLIHICRNEPTDENAEKLRELESSIPPEHLQSYKEIYNRNYQLNCQLARLLAEGVIQKLVLAQDDGEAFSLPNMRLEEFVNYVNNQSIDSNSLQIIHGADEVALSILTNIAKKNYIPPKNFKVYVDYNNPDTPKNFMPYMAINNSQTADERLVFHGSKQVAAPADADYILFISCGSRSTMNDRKKTINRLKQYIADGKPVALVDLSENFAAQETLFPLMLKDNFPMNRLVAYAGWNTASNSIGTAIAQTEIYLTALSAKSNKDSVVYYNLHNLNNRFFEDYYYLKDIIDLVNISLKKKGYTNVYDLDLKHNYIWSDDMLKKSLQQRLYQYKYSTSCNTPVFIPEANASFSVTDISLEAFFPWPRTFEIYLNTSLKITKHKTQ